MERLSIDYPASHRLKLNLRTNVLNSMKSQRMSKKNGGVKGLKSERAWKENTMEMKKRQKIKEKQKEKVSGYVCRGPSEASTEPWLLINV